MVGGLQVEPISLLTTLDENYLPQLQILLTSLSFNNLNDTFSIFLLHGGISEDALVPIQRQCDKYGYSFLSVRVDDDLFEDAPVTQQYPKEMYYRLLAPYLLPKPAKRILYLDPDILVINPLRPLWERNWRAISLLPQPIQARRSWPITSTNCGLGQTGLTTTPVSY